jgi:hypothetical protein
MTQALTEIYDIMKSSTKFNKDRLRGEFGVEIETETDKAYDYPSLKFWKTEKDNSLRDWGVEYVLKQPMDLPELEKALHEFDLCEKKYKFRKGSVSTSVHVHCNFFNDTFRTLANFVTIYALMENLLIRYSGPDRLSNLFCLPICDAEGVKDNIQKILTDVNRGRYDRMGVSADRCKYGGINPAPLTNLGTIEIRTFRGETDIKIIQKWVEIIQKIKDFSRRDLSPPDILELWRTNKDSLIEVVFQEYGAELRVKDQKGKDISGELIRQNLKYAADFACVSKDWSKFGILKIKMVYKEKVKPELDAISQEMFRVPFDTLGYHERLVVAERYHRHNSTVKVVDLDEDI